MDAFRRIVASIGFAIGAAALLLILTGSAASADPGDYGTEGPSFASRPSNPVSEKPQSRLWHRNGEWYGVLWSDQAATWNIFQRNGGTGQWTDTGVVVDNRANTSVDTLWDGTHLYVASHVVNVSSDTFPNPADPGSPARLYRYSYSGGNFTLDAGFPTDITDYSSETLTIAKDSLGQIWASWTQVGPSSSGYATQVYVNSTSGDDRTWGVPYVPPVPGVNLEADDISAITSFAGNRIGVIWSNQDDEIVYWAEHVDGAGAGAWSGAIASSGNNIADDHLNLKSLQSDSQGRVYAAVKTSLDSYGGSQPQLHLLVLQPSTGSWTTSVFGTVSDCHTRPLVVLDETHQAVHMFATAPTSSGCPWSGYAGSIYAKSAPMANPVFPAGRGTPVLQDLSDDAMNDVSSTKQAVNDASGLVIVAANYDTERYWSTSVPLTDPGPGDPVPAASFTPSVTSGDAPLAVSFTDTSSNSPTSWAWDFGDGATSTAQNPSHTFSEPGQYAVTLVASNGSGASAPVSVTITAVDPAGDPVPVASFTPSVTAGAAPLSVSFTDTSSNSPTSWAWDFGDGATSTEQNPSHTYANPGSYTVSLVATNGVGSSAPATTAVVATGGSGSTSVTVGASSSAQSSGSATVALSKPVGLADGDVVIAQITSNNKPGMSSVPAGWVELSPSEALGRKAEVFTYYKVIGSAAAEPSSWTWQLGSSEKWGAGLTAFSGVDGAAPFGSAVSVATGSGSGVSVPGVSVTTTGSVLVGGVGIDSGGATISPPSGWTEAWESGQQRAELAHLGPAPTGVTGTVSWSLSYGVPWTAWMVALQPGGPAGPGDPAPVALFSPSVTSGEAPLAVSFTDSSSNAPTSWAWDFGDGATSTQQNPSHTFTSAGSYSVSLVASNAAGASDPVSVTISVTNPGPGDPVPVASFSPSVTSGEAPLVVSFTDSSSNAPTSWAWDFGDGATSTQQNPSHTFTSAGSYAVSLVASNATGPSAPVSATITVTDPPPPGGLVTVGGSSAAESSGSSTVTLDKPAGLADGDVVIAQITSNNAPDMASVPAGWSELVAPTSLSGMAKVFTYTKVVGSAAAEPSSWSWQLSSSEKWGAGLTAFSGVDPSSPFGSTVSVASGAGSGVSVPGVSVPTAGSVLVGGVGIDSGGASISPPSGWTEAWESGQQAAEFAVLEGPAAGSTGTVSWSLTYGVAWTAWMVALQPLDPNGPGVPASVASFSPSVTSGEAPLVVSFTDSSSNAPTSWAWDFGDGATSTQQSPSHTFTSAGSYSVSLVASNATGPSAPVSATITVTDPPPPPPSGGAVTVGGSSSAESSGSSTVTLDKPAGLADGDVVIAQITSNNKPGMSSVPAGWVELSPSVALGNKAEVFTYSLVVGSAASEPSSWTWQLGSSQKWGAGLTAFSGVDTAAPFGSAVSLASGAGSGVSVPGVSVPTAGSVLVGGVGIDSGGASISPPSGWTEAWESGQQRAELAMLEDPAVGSTGTVSWSLSYGVPWTAWMVVLQPA